MGWTNDEPQIKKEGMLTSSKILLGIIACLVVIIILILVLLLNIQINTYNIAVDGQIVNTTNKEKLLTTIDGITYINIEEFSKLVGYEYHQNEEFKGYTKEENKCYVQGTYEAATFFLNDNKVSKLPVGKLTEDYREFTVENTIKDVNGKMYAPIEAISIEFNVIIDEQEKSISIYKLNYLVTSYDEKVKKWGYIGIADQSFENQKSLLYGYFIVKKENGLYKIIDDKQQEIVSDKYTSIEFSENTKEFFVTNSLGQVGIINLDGTTKIEPVYESISILDKSSDLYLVQKDEKYGVVKSGNISIILPEYDSIGIDTGKTQINLSSKYLMLDTLIPVCQNNKWGAFDKTGKLIYKLEYDSFGCDITTIEVADGVKKEVEPIIEIERCKGIVVKKNDKYGVLDITGKELVPISVESIYSIKDIEDENSKYFMLYNGKELNVIERLIIAGLIEDTSNNDTEEKNTTTTNTIQNMTNNTSNENISNNTTKNNTNNIISSTNITNNTK